MMNAIDVGSRPYGHSAWVGKPAAVISASPGALGAFGANQHLRQPLMAVDVSTMQHLEAYIGGSNALSDPAGEFVTPATHEFCVKFLGSFATWIHRTTLKS